MERRYVLFTDDELAAQAEVNIRRGDSSPTGLAYRGWDMGRVADMTDPPETTKTFCVFQIEGNK